jgi:protein-disulfide isomerase
MIIRRRKNNKIIIWLIVAVALVALIFLGTIFNQRPDYQVKKFDRPFWGNQQAQIDIVEYSDFSCPACQSAQAMTKILKDRWSDRIKFSYRHFPLIGLQGHEQSLAAAEAAECAYEQDQFWPYHDLLFANQPAFSPEALARSARQLNLNEADFDQCLASRVKAEVVKNDRVEALGKNVDSTPTFYLNGVLVPDWRTLPQMVSSALGEKSPIQ